MDVPFRCIRAVPIRGRQFAVRFQSLSDKDGAFSRTKIALAAMARPLR